MPILKLSILRGELIVKDWNILIFIGYTYSNPGKFDGLSQTMKSQNKKNIYGYPKIIQTTTWSVKSAHNDILSYRFCSLR